MKNKNENRTGTLVFGILSLFSLITAAMYTLTGSDSALYNAFAALWLFVMALGCVLAGRGRGARWACVLYLVSVLLYGLLGLVSSFLLMIAMGAMSFGGRAYLLLRGLPLCLVFLCGSLLGLSKYCGE